MAAKKVEVTEVTAAELFDKQAGVPVSSVRLHAAYEAPGAFAMERTINKTKVKGVRLKFDGHVLWWHKDKAWGFIPAAAINGGVCE